MDRTELSYFHDGLRRVRTPEVYELKLSLMRDKILNCFPIYFSDFINEDIFQEVVEDLLAYGMTINYEFELADIRGGIVVVDIEWFYQMGGKKKIELLRQDTSKYLFVCLQGIPLWCIPSIHNANETLFPVRIAYYSFCLDVNIQPDTFFEIQVPISQIRPYVVKLREYVKLLNKIFGLDIRRFEIEVKDFFSVIPDLYCKLRPQVFYMSVRDLYARIDETQDTEDTEVGTHVDIPCELNVPLVLGLRSKTKRHLSSKSESDIDVEPNLSSKSSKIERHLSSKSDPGVGIINPKLGNKYNMDVFPTITPFESSWTIDEDVLAITLLNI